MQIGEISYDDTPLEGSTYTGDVIDTFVEYTPTGGLGAANKVRRQPVRLMVYEAEFRTPGRQVPMKDGKGNVVYHMKDGSPVKPKLVREKDTVEKGLYYLCPVAQTGLQQIVRLPDDWKEIQKRERASVAGQSGDGLVEAIAALNAKIEENERLRREENERVLAGLKTLGLKPEDIGMTGKGK